MAKFDVEDDWEEEDSEEEVISSPATLRKLKQKLRTGKRPHSSNWKESPVEGEVEIVIPNKKYKGNDKSLTVKVTPEVRLYKFNLI